jgi:antitoxin CptB
MVSINDSVELRRLRWRCRRGLLELDVLLSNFLEQGYPDLSPEEQANFARLIETTDDAELMRWLVNGSMLF